MAASQLLEGLQKSLATILKSKRVGESTRKRVLGATSEYIMRQTDEFGEELDMAELVEKVKSVANRAGDAARAGKQNEVDIILRELVPAKKTKQALTPERLERKAAKARERRRDPLLKERDEDGIEELSDESARRLFGENADEEMAALKAASPEEQEELLVSYRNRVNRAKLKSGQIGTETIAKTEESRALRKAQRDAVSSKKKKGGKKKKTTATKKSEAPAAKKRKPTEDLRPVSKETKEAVAEAKVNVPKTEAKAAKDYKKAKAAERKKTKPATGAAKQAKTEQNRREWYAKNADNYDEARVKQGKPKMTADERAAYIDRLAKQAEEARKRRGK